MDLLAADLNMDTLADLTTNTLADLNTSVRPMQVEPAGGVVHRVLAHLAVAKSPNFALHAGLLITVLLGAQLSQYVIATLRKPRLPTVNHQCWDPWGDKAKKQYLSHARQLIQDGFNKFGGPFYLRTEVDKTVLLPPEYIDAVDREEGLDFIEFTKTHFLGQFETFSSFSGKQSEPGHFQEAVIKGLTRSLPRHTVPLSKEMANALHDTFGDNTEWHEVWLRGDVLKWVTRLSARIFVGDPLASDKEWLRISEEYTVNMFSTIDKIKTYPRLLWWLVERFHPMARKCRADRAKCHELLQPHVAARHQEWARAEREGRKPDVPDDSLEWFRSAARGRRYNHVGIQIGLSNAAIHTTSDLIGQAVLNLCKYPDVVPPIRREIVQVLKKYGWQKVALTEARHLDSFLKETQRFKPIGMVFMARKAVRDVTLPGDLTIRKGMDTAISSHRMWSRDSYGPDVAHFHPWRFLQRRQDPRHQNTALLVSTSPDHTAFGHGRHACPGRFFAVNEVKIALIHLLIKYDFRFPPAHTPPHAECVEFGVTMLANPAATISVRRRERVEIDLDAIHPDPA